jgi:MHS family proline/betaine transporter-like MFS transporter
MILATVGQGCLPGKYFGGEFQLVGFVLLMICRALQGLSAGGEIGAVSAYLMEVSPVRTIGMAVCMISVGSQIAWAFASAMMALLNQALGKELMLVWGWRIPFIVSAVPGVVAMWGRNQIQETEAFVSEVRDN